MEMIQAHWYEIGVLILNAWIGYHNKDIKAKLAGLRTEMFERFLTKDDYYAHQKTKG